MGNLTLNGSSSGQVTIAPPSVAGSNTLTLPAVTDTVTTNAATQTLTNKTLTSPVLNSPTINTPTMGGSVITSGIAQASTSGTSIDFTSIPSWVKRITVMLNGVSTNGTANFLCQIGSGSIATTGYASRASFFAGSTLGGGNSSAGFVFGNFASANTISGALTLTLLGSNTWVATGYFADSGSNATSTGGNSPALSGALDRVRITTAGSDTFDAGLINIFYE